MTRHRKHPQHRASFPAMLVLAMAATIAIMLLAAGRPAQAQAASGYDSFAHSYAFGSVKKGKGKRARQLRAMLRMRKRLRSRGRIARHLRNNCIKATGRQVDRMPDDLRERCRRIRAKAIKRGVLIRNAHSGTYFPRTKVDWHGTVLATWYGPGFYGQRTGCGSTLRTSTWGIAHRTLPCGTLVAISYRGTTIAVPVVDRGPFGHAQVDLAGRVKEHLRFSGSDSIRMGIVEGRRVPLRKL